MRSSLFILGLVFITGCSRASDGIFSSSATSANGAAQLLVANKLMAIDKQVYASPLNGGLMTKLYIQPRGLMSVPDDQVTGCGQAGLGALGIDAYLVHPEWIGEQRVLLSDVFVPTRNFSQGFPLSNANGPTPSIRSFFVLDGQGYFRLADGEVEGDYQFATIADDGARLLIKDGSNFVTVVDGQKPAGPNGGCLEQTQSAHMSCTTNWSDNSAAAVKTVHLKPGQAVPIELQYWQGPGYGLAMMAFYRRVDPANLIDASCGQERGYGDGSSALSDVMKTWTPLSIGNLSN